MGVVVCMGECSGVRSPSTKTTQVELLRSVGEVDEGGPWESDVPVPSRDFLRREPFRRTVHTGLVDSCESVVRGTWTLEAPPVRKSSRLRSVYWSSRWPSSGRHF